MGGLKTETVQDVSMTSHMPIQTGINATGILKILQLVDTTIQPISFRRKLAVHVPMLITLMEVMIMKIAKMTLQ